MNQIRNQKGVLLEPKDCEAAMRTEITIGSYCSSCGHSKKFTFAVWENEYRVYKNGELIDGGQALEELLDVYNFEI